MLGDVRDLEAAASAIGWGIFYNGGQTCNAGLAAGGRPRCPRRARGRASPISAAQLAPGDPLDPATASARWSTSASWPDRARLRRPRAARRCPASSSAAARVREETGGYYLPPTILGGVDNRMRVAREEIFGPVPDRDRGRRRRRSASGDRERLALRAGGRGLDPGRHEGAPDRPARLRAGTVWVNTFDTADHTVPFGGFRQSGFGRDKSLHALDGYTQLKTTWLDLSD